jgi:hypothetical protein
MKKLVLFALLVAVAASAQAAWIGPKPNQQYQCWYHNYSGVAVNGGHSRFDITSSGSSLQRGIEYFDAYLLRLGYYTENYKVTFSNPVAIRGPHEPGVPGPGPVIGTRWQFTFNPSGPQCSAEVYDDDNGNGIYFSNCTDGHSRECYLVP